MTSPSYFYTSYWSRLLASCFLAGLISLGSCVAHASQPHITQGPNLLTPVINYSYAPSWMTLNCQDNYWAVQGYGCGVSFTAGASFDPAVSFDTGSGTGSAKLPAIGSETKASFLPVTPGQLYTYSGYSKSDVWPSPILMINARYYDSNKVALPNISNEYFARWGASKVNSWEEFAYPFRPPPGTAFIQITAKIEEWTDGTQGTTWVDHFHVSEDIGFASPPSPKKAFNGTAVRADELGNIEVKRNGIWEPFFPFCVYADNNRPDWSFYSDNGFNCSMRATDAAQVQQGTDAGLMSGMELGWYMVSRYPSSYGDTALLQSRIEDIEAAGLMDSLLWYYWDNENEALHEWQVPTDVVNTVRQVDQNRHPVYVLQGHEGIARKYNNQLATISDIVGEYVGGDDGITYHRGAIGHVVLDNIEGQINPIVIAQLNNGVGLQFRARLYTAIAKGARGLGYWKDGYNASNAQPLEDVPWLADFANNISQEIQQLLPLIREPHWTAWKAESSSALIDFGTRDYQGGGYIIVANSQAVPITTTFTLTGMPYTSELVTDYFSNANITAVANSQFTITVPAYESAVYRLAIDSDGDGASDYTEQCWDSDCASYDPYDLVTNPGGGDTDVSKQDTDGDGYRDGTEITLGSDPLDAGSTPTIVADGDVNLDGQVNVADILLAQRSILGLATLTAEQVAHGDYRPAPSGDGQLGVADLVMIIKAALI